MKIGEFFYVMTIFYNHQFSELDDNKIINQDIEDEYFDEVDTSNKETIYNGEQDF